MVALNYGVRHPEHASRLVLPSTTATLRLDRVRAAFRRLGGPEAETVADQFWADPNEKTFAEYLRVCMPLYTRTKPIAEALERTEKNLDLAFRWFAGEFRTFDIRAQLTRLRRPTLLVAGEEDPITTVADAEDIQASAPPGVVQLERVPDAGHGVFRDKPELFFDLLTGFL
jgi:proline iminopeptidase